MENSPEVQEHLRLIEKMSGALSEDWQSAKKVARATQLPREVVDEMLYEMELGEVVETDGRRWRFNGRRPSSP